MTVEDQNQRKDGVKFATELKAPKTLEVIKDPTKGIDAILQSVVSEVGIDKVVPIILESKYPYWALGALRYIPNLGKYEEPLRKKAGILSLSTDNKVHKNHAQGVAAGGNLPRINAFSLYVACGAGYCSNFTMYYFTPPFQNEWRGNNSNNTGSYKCICVSAVSAPCVNFSIPETPLTAGDTVMMVMGIEAGPWYQTGVWFTFDPNANVTAAITGHGQTFNPSVDWSLQQNT